MNKEAVVTDNRESKCGHCPGSKCCTYVTQEIESPRSKLDFDNLLWQISHEGVQVYKEKRSWYLLFHNRCLHLQGDGRCGIYTERPQACREHSNDYCELDAPAEDGFDLFFPDYNALLTYCRKRFKRWGA
ncbi:MAG: YkgJ family cysteine cluster protein [Gammaproteobacteria bacterium]|nr:YkgJ family cysteine cluster protein [Gammaproteobacteria bacterium]